MKKRTKPESPLLKLVPSAVNKAKRDKDAIKAVDNTPKVDSFTLGFMRDFVGNDVVRSDSGDATLRVSGVDIPLPKLPDEVEILNYHIADPSKQKWRRQNEPDWVLVGYLAWKTRREQFYATGGTESEYHLTKDEESVFEYIESEYARIRNGVHFYNNGVPTYITGDHYFYLNYFFLKDGKRPRYRDADRNWFLFLEWCIRNPNVLGMLCLARRQEGKTSKSAAVMVKYAITIANFNGYIQSRDGSSAEKVFTETIAPALKKLPDWLLPNQDGEAVKSVYFRAKSVTKGVNNQTNIYDEKLSMDSFIVCAESGEAGAVNGPSPTILFEDEYGSTKGIIDIEERQRTHKENTRFMLYASTIQEMKDPNTLVMVRGLWENSKYSQLLEEGSTTSGLVQYFNPAYMGYEKMHVTPRISYVDEYGNSQINEAIASILKDRARLSGKALTQAMRNNPLTPEEALMDDVDGCLFDVAKLTKRRQELEIFQSRKDRKEPNGANVSKRGFLRWKDNIPYTKVEWMESENGPFWINRHPEFPNNVTFEINEDTGEKDYMPMNKGYVIGIDPYNFEDATSKASKLSKGSGAVYMKWQGYIDPTHQKRKTTVPYSGDFHAIYLNRPESNSTFYKEMIMLMWYYGSKANVEKNAENMLVEMRKAGMKKYFSYGKFRSEKDADKRPSRGDESKGDYTTADSKVEWGEYMQDYFMFNIDPEAEYNMEPVNGCFFQDIITQSLPWSPAVANKYDLFAACGIALRGAFKQEIVPTERDEYKGNELEMLIFAKDIATRAGVRYY